MDQSLHEKMMKLHGGSNEPGHSMGSMKKASFNVALKSKKQIAEGTMAFVFEKPKGFKFRAGQHVRMSLIDPPETDNEGDSRFLSLACTPQDNDLTVAMRMRDTAFKRTLKNMQPGDKVRIQILLGVPHGAFALHDDSSKPAVFVVGGIGIVPAYSMIKDATEKKLSHKLTLFYSNRRPEDAPFLNELQSLAKKNPNFELVATMTEAEKSAQTWQGETEFISQDMLAKYLDDLQSPIYYVSGLPNMVSSVREILANAGVNTDNIKAEEFTGFDLNDITNNQSKKPKNLVAVAATALILIAIAGAAALHATGAGSVFSSLSFTSPLSYIIIGVLAAAVVFKFKLLITLKRKRTSSREGKTKNE